MRLRRYVLLLLAAGLIALAPPASAAGDKGIGLDELLATVTATHPLFARERASVAAADAAADEAAGGEAWVASLSGYTARDQYPRTAPLTPEQVDRQGVDASVSRPVWATGGELTVAYGYSRTDQQVPGIVMPLMPGQPPVTVPGDTAVYYQGGGLLTYRQPLWQDRGGKVSGMAADLARWGAAAERIGSREREEQFLAGVALRYVDWAFLREQRRIAEARAALTRTDRDRVREMRRGNLVEAVDLIRSDDAVLAAEQGVASARTAETAAAEELARNTGVAAVATGSPAFDLYALPPFPSPDEAEAAVEEVRPLTELSARIAQADRGVEGRESLSDPRLDLVLTGGAENAGDASGDGFGSDAVDYSAALTFTYPLGNGAPEAARARALRERERLTAQREQTARELAAAARGMAVRLAGYRRVIAADRERIDAARARADAEMARYRQGRSDYTFVIAARDGVWQAKLQHAADAAVCQSLVIQLQSLTDRLHRDRER